MRAAAIVHFLDGALSISPGSCSASLRPIIHSQQSEGRIPTTQRPTIAQATASPSQGFLIALAFCGLAGSFLLTPRERIETPSLSVLFAHRAASKAKASELASHVVDSAALEQDVVSRYEYRPLASFLGRRTRDAETAARIARAIVKESGRLEVAPSLLMGVLLTENPRLEAATVSSQGAIGLMQVMNFHAGEFDCESDDLLQIESNICHGAHVFVGYLTRTGDVQRALLRYNGCIASVNTPNCHRYPAKVMRAAHQVRRQLLLYQASHLNETD